MPLSLAISFSKCRQLGACKCRGDDLPNGSVMMLGMAPDMGAGVDDMVGGVNPTAVVETL